MRPFRLSQIMGAKEIIEVQGIKKFVKRSYRRYSSDPDLDIKNAINHYANKYNIFCDIGAAIGDVTFSVADSFTHCLCFEPEEKNYQEFLQKMKNSNFNNIEIFNVALGKGTGRKKFFVSKQGRLDNRFNIEKNEKFDESEVKVETLDNICTKLAINEKILIKIDVQGGEFDVMKGAKKILRHNCVIISEFWPWALRLNNAEPMEYVKFMESEGYKFFSLQNKMIDKKYLEKICYAKNKKFIHDDFIIKKYENEN